MTFSEKGKKIRNPTDIQKFEILLVSNNINNNKIIRNFFSLEKYVMLNERQKAAFFMNFI